MNPTEFYFNVLHKLIPVILKIESVGIPIDVKELEKLKTSMGNIREDTSNGIQKLEAVKNYLCQVDGEVPKIEYNPKNRIHKSYLINRWLRENGYENMEQPEWTSGDIDKMCSIIDIDIRSIFMKNLIERAMADFAIDKQIIKKRKKFNMNSNKDKLNLLNSLGFGVDNVKNDTLLNLLRILEWK